MKPRSLVVAFFMAFVLVIMLASRDRAWSRRLPTTPPVAYPVPAAIAPLPDLRLAGKTPAKPAEPTRYLKQFQEATDDLDQIDGLFTLYRDRQGNKLLAEVREDQLNQYFLCAMTLESGLGEQGIISGLSLADFVFNWRWVNNSIQFVASNIYFRAQPEDALRRGLPRSFSDSILATLDIKGYNPRHKAYLVDLEPMLMGDLPGLTPLLTVLLGTPYELDPHKSHISQAKAFPRNVELESVYGFNGTPAPDALPVYFTTLPDSRTFTLRVRYSFSQLPTTNGYRPRPADERVGYFISAFQNLSLKTPNAPFVRYINRWQLEKQDPAAALSPPKQPIVFWLENTIPQEYRAAVRDGVLMWNQAFAKLGFQDAIQVEQMPDRASWDPADIRYNTIRWVSSYEDAFLGIGQTHTNPLTGQILDADILIDSGFIHSLHQEHRSLVEARQWQAMPALAQWVGEPLCSYGALGRSPAPKPTPAPPRHTPTRSPAPYRGMSNYDLCYGLESAQQFAVGALALSLTQGVAVNSPDMTAYTQAFLRSLIAHEVGHVLGLRHNFRGSAMLTPAELNNTEITHKQGLVASVMDYSAVNLAPPGTTQGDYFPQTIGPYDEWAIAYGYTPLPPHRTQPETEILTAIARQAPTPDFAYGTDEDAYAGLDPQIQRFDLSSDLLTYAPQQLTLARQMWAKLDQQYPKLGGSFSDVRMIFDEIFRYYFHYALLLSNYVGGQHFNRYQGGDAIGRLPFESVALTEQQRALSLLSQYVFDAESFQFSPRLINKLAPARWWHWGQTPLMSSLDYPIHDRILALQRSVLYELLDDRRLARLRDAELKNPATQALLLPDLFTTLQSAIWETPLTAAKPLRLSSLQRGIQREYLTQLSEMVLGQTTVPEDARVLAWYNLKQLRGTLDGVLKRRDREMDTTTKAHLEATRDRILKILEAQLFTQ